MPTSDVRVGILGAGFMGDTHAQALRQVIGARLVAAADPDETRLAGFAHAHSVDRVSTVPAELLEAPDLDLVIVAAPNALHAPLAAAALSAGKHVLVEKPLALTLDDTRTLSQLARAGGRVLAYGENLIFAPKLRRLRELASQEDAMGHVYHQRHVFETPGPDGGWWLDPTMAGAGSMLDLGCHAVALSCWIYQGSRPLAVSGHLRTIDRNRYGALDDFGTAWINFEGGRTAEVQTSWLRHAGEEVTAEVMGTRGLMKADLWKDMGLLGYTQARFSSIWEPASGWVHPEWEWIRNSGYPQQLESIVGAIRTEAPVEAGSDLWLVVLEILLAAYRSAVTGRTVTLPLDDAGASTPAAYHRQYGAGG